MHFSAVPAITNSLRSFGQYMLTIMSAASGSEHNEVLAVASIQSIPTVTCDILFMNIFFKCLFIQILINITKNMVNYQKKIYTINHISPTAHEMLNAR